MSPRGPLFLRRVFLAFSIAFATNAANAQAAPTSQNTGTAPSCPVRMTPPSAADIAYFHSNFADAADLYRKAAKERGPEGDRAHNGLIRSLLEEGKVNEAEADAMAWVTASPQTALAFDSLAEVELREAHIDKVIPNIQAAGRLDRCDMRTHVNFAVFNELTAMWATAKAHLDIAHKYEPTDLEIGSRWASLQPRSVRIEELKRFLDHSPFLTDEERKQSQRRMDILESSNHCRLSSAVTSTSIPYAQLVDHPQSEVTWGLKATLNGTDRFLEIDTGASGLLLNRRAAEALHLTPAFESKAGGIGDNGLVKTYIAPVKNIRIGNLEFTDCLVTVLENSSQLHEGADGLIGSDVFSDFLVTLDFPGQKMQLDPLPEPPGTQAVTTSLDTAGADDRPVHDAYIAPSMSSWSSIFRVGHEMFLPVRLNQGPVRLFLLDTGADLTSISPSDAKAVSKLGASPMEIHGLSGEVKKVYSTGPIKMDFAGIRYPATSLPAFDIQHLSDDAGIEISGFLGAGILRQLTMRIDYRDDLVSFTYDPKRLTPCMPGVYRADCYQAR